MQVVFVGVGEACDQEQGNTSVFVQSGNTGILLDCGFSAAHAVFPYLFSGKNLDAVWISHFHGDHFLGLPLLLLRLWEEGRQDALTVLGPPGIDEIVPQAMNLAYPGFWDKLSFPLHLKSLEPARPVTHLGMTWRVAWTEHSQPNLGLRLDGPEAGLYYSGDGRPGPGTRDLIQGCALVVHEGFQIERAVHGHGTVREVMTLAEEARAKMLAVVHMQREERRYGAGRVRDMLEGMAGVHGFLPEAGETVHIP